MKRPDFATRQLLESISSLPTLVVVVMATLSIWHATTIDNPEELPEWLAVLDLKDIDTIRTLLAAVIGGVFTLTVFSYTMVMDVMNRAISNYSPRLLPLLLAQRYHQFILGFSVGTITHALIMLLVTSEPSELRPHPPILAAATSGLLGIACLFLFIYFIHYISQSLHINRLMRASYDDTRKSIDELRKFGDATNLKNPEARELDGKPDLSEVVLKADRTGYLYQIDYQGLADMASKCGGSLELIPKPADFVLTGDILLRGSKRADEDLRHDLRGNIRITPEVPMSEYVSGFKHLTEVAVKACSPAVNDPGTALTAVDYLTDLFRALSHREVRSSVEGDGGWLYFSPWTVDALADLCIPELERYLSGEPWTEQKLDYCKRRIGEFRRTAE